MTLSVTKYCRSEMCKSNIRKQEGKFDVLKYEREVCAHTLQQQIDLKNVK